MYGPKERTLICMWTPAGNDRYTWQYDADGAGVADPERPRRLYDPGDGSLIETSGATLVRYPAASLDDDGMIWNESGRTQVVQNVGGDWDPRSDDFWALLEQASDTDHPVWQGARETGKTEQEPEPLPAEDLGKRKHARSQSTDNPEVPDPTEASE